jgi:hypothetical protein
LAFVGLAAFIGLALDGGILFTSIGHLRRAVDAAALAAANQFREGRTVVEMDTSANELVNLNSLNPADADIHICDIISATPDPLYHEAALCPTGGDPYRKFVRVEADMDVPLAFLPVVGWDTLTIHAEAISEAASIDLVLVIDTSSSEAFDLCFDGIDNDEDLVVDDCNVPGAASLQVGVGSDSDWDGSGNGSVPCNLNRFILDTNGAGVDMPGPPPDGDREDDCHPFEEIRAASIGLMNRMYFPYDRLALVTYSDIAGVDLDLATGDNAASVAAALTAMEVDDDPGNPPCNFAATLDPRGCTSTNTGEGMRIGGSQFGAFLREEAVWIVILLTDGQANAARDSVPNWICPGAPGAPTWISPFCRDEVFEIDQGNYGYDAEDDAQYWAGWVGCPNASVIPQPADCVSPPMGGPAYGGGQGAVIFTIGLGDLVTNSTTCDPFYGGGCEPDAGEELMRWIAAVGDDGDPSTDPCAATGVGVSCGNYYFSPTGAGLQAVFEAIASRIFTRLTH